MFTSGAEDYPRLQYFLKSTQHLLERKVPCFQLKYSERIEYSTESVSLTLVSKLSYLGLFPCSSAEVGKLLGLTIDFILTFWEKMHELTNKTSKQWGLHFLLLQHLYITKSNLTLSKANFKPSLLFLHQHQVPWPHSAREHAWAVLDNFSQYNLSDQGFTYTRLEGEESSPNCQVTVSVGEHRERKLLLNLSNVKLF